MAVKFYKCELCGNIVCKVEDSTLPLVCCGHQMTEHNASAKDGALEKHVPVYDVINNTVSVKVGSEPHPMEETHHIDFIVLETNKGFQIKYIYNENSASCCFKICDNETVVNVYEYCNLHGLYKAQ